MNIGVDGVERLIEALSGRLGMVSVLDCANKHIIGRIKSTLLVKKIFMPGLAAHVGERSNAVKCLNCGQICVPVVLLSADWPCDYQVFFGFCGELQILVDNLLFLDVI